MVVTRPDIAYAVGVVSRFMANPGKAHWNAVKSIMRYLKGTKNKCLCYGKDPLELKGFCDSDMAGDVDTRKSTSGYVFRLASCAVSWCSRLQKVFSLSTNEAEYNSVTEASKEAIWLARLCSEFGLPEKAPMLGCDRLIARVPCVWQRMLCFMHAQNILMCDITSFEKCLRMALSH